MGAIILFSFIISKDFFIAVSSATLFEDFFTSKNSLISFN